MLSPNAFNLLVEIDPACKAQLTALLEQIADDLARNPIFRFPELSLIHFGRFVILDEVEDHGTQKYPAYLVLSTNYDGSLDEHLNQLLGHSPAGIDQIFACCKGYPPSPLSLPQRKAFFLAHASKRPYFYRGTWGRTVAQIKREETFRKIAEDKIDQLSPQELSLPQLRDELVDAVQKSPEFVDAPEVKTPRLGWKNILPLAFFLLTFLILVIPFMLFLRILEALDRQFDQTSSEQERTKSLAAQEDFQGQNQLSHLVEVKNGWFRQITLRFVLHGIDWLAKYFFNQGNLGGIPTIHYARWILIDGGKRLLFFSNFDGSWESYLGDFVDKGTVGLTGVWSNTKGFPFTRFLLFKGARDEQRFKAWTRDHQIFTHVWYTAYPDLSIDNIHNNATIHTGLCQGVPESELADWLSHY